MAGRIKKIVACTLVFGLLSALAGCGSAGGAEEKQKIPVRIAYFPNINHTQALVMKNRRALEEKWGDKCEVKWISFNAGPAEMEAIFAGEIDMGYIGPVPALSTHVKSGGDVKIISNCTNGGAVLLKRKGSGIDTVRDLSGRKVAVPQLGNTQHLCLLSILAENGLKSTDKGGDVTVIASSNADILNLMDNGSVDAALVPEPWGTTIENNGSAEVLLDYDKVFMEGEYPSALVITGRDFMDAHPELVKDFLQVHGETTEYINDNREKAQAIVNEGIREATGKALDEKVIGSAFDRMTVTTELNREAIMEFASMSKEEGFINKVPEENDVFAIEIGQ